MRKGKHECKDHQGLAQTKTQISSHAKAASNIDPAELARRIARMIKRETYLGVQDMKVRFENGTLILSGLCHTFYTKQLAQEAALKIMGDVDLVNAIHVA